MSLANLTMYTAVIPTYIPKDRKGKRGRRREGEEVIRMDDPANRGRVAKMIDSFR